MANTTQTNQVNKIYSIELKGIDSANAGAEQLVKNFQALTAAKKELNALKDTIIDPAVLSRVIAQMKDLDAQQQSIVKNLKGGTDAADKQTGAYLALVKQYKDAKTAAQDLGASIGVQSDEYKAAAANAELLRVKIAEINAVSKAAVNTVDNADIPFEAQTGNNPNNGADVTTGSTEAQIAAEKERLTLLREERIAREALTETERAAAAAAAAASGAYSEQTAALRANVAALIANEETLALNKLQQKEILLAAKESGGLTALQTEQLVTLRVEQLQLIENNKTLSATTRNQAKEFLTEVGSIAELRVQVALLKAEIVQSGESADQSAVQKLKDQLDILNPKLIEAEFALGIFGRNVGNYPKLFQSAFLPLERELDTIKAKLLAGGLGEAEVADLTAKQKALNAALAVGTKEFASATAQANAYKTVNQEIGLAFGTESEVFKEFTEGILEGNNEIKKVDTSIKAAGESTTKLGKGFSTVFSGLRNIANIIPGLGIQGIVLLLLAPLATLASSLFETASNFKLVGSAGVDAGEKLEATNAAIDSAKSKAADAALNISNLRIAIEAAKTGFANKDVVLKQYNETIGETTGKVTSLDQAEQELNKNAEAFIRFTLLKAAAQEAQKKSAEKLVEATIESQKELAEFSNVVVDKTISTGGPLGFGTGAFNATEEDRRAKAAEQAEAKRQQKIIDAKNKEKAVFDNVAKELFDKAQAIAKQYNFSAIPDTTKATKARADNLNVAEQNAIKEIEANRLRLLAIENTSTNEIQKVRQLSFEEEIAHLNAVLKINVDALNAKQALINRDKTLNTEQARSIAEFGEQRSTLELQTSQKIQAIRKKEFDDINKNLELQLKAQLQVIEAATKEAETNPALSATDKALIKANSNNQALQLEQQYLQQLADLDDRFNKEAIAKARIDAEKAAEAVRQGRALIAQAELKDIQTEGENNANAINLAYSKQIQAILENETLAVDKKRELIARLAKSENITILSNELTTLTAQVAKEKQLLDLNLISNEQYLATLKKQQKAAENLLVAQTATPSKSPLAALFGFKAGSNEEKGVAAVAQSAFALATDAMNGYFDAERNRIQGSLKLAEDRIEADRKVSLSQAQSAAEQDSLNKQFDAKKLAAQKAAFEQTKKVKKGEAKIAFATEIANIFSTAYQLGPIAGPIVGAVLAGLAITRLGLNLNRIDKEQFARGGKVPTRGGKFGGKPHSQGGTDFDYQGRTFNAEIDELAVIRTRDAAKNRQYTISGNHTQIASMLNQLGGGVPFAPGAKLRKFEFGGNLGESLQAPAFSVSLNGSLELFASGIAKLDTKTDAINNRIDRLQVIQQTSTVTDAQARQNNQKNVAVL